jgi:ATP-dependent helicase/nuclease subunit A
MSCKELMTAQVSCPGSWVLLAALHRTEAGEFFAISEHPDCVRVRDIPWTIRVAQAPDNVADIAEEEMQTLPLPEHILEKMRCGLSFQYAHHSAVAVPSKLTATQVKGRLKDQESTENTGTRITQQFTFAAPG